MLDICNKKKALLKEDFEQSALQVEEFFEGTEKLLEVWFTVAPDDGKRNSLRNIPK